MGGQFTPWVLPLGLSLLLPLAFAVYGLRSYRRHSEETHLLAFAVFVAATSGWIALTAGQQLTPSHDLKLLFVNAASAMFVPVTLYGVLWFALTYTGNERWVGRWLFVLAAGHVLVSSVAFALFPNVLYETSVVTVSGTTLFGVRFDPYVVLKRDPTPWFVLLQVYGYAVLLLSSGIVGRFLFRYRERLYSGQAVALLAAILVPVTANALLFVGAVPADYNLTELSFTVSVSAFAVGIFRYRLFDLVPVARDTVIEDMGDGFVVCNDRNVVLDANPAALDILGADTGSLTGRPVVEVLPGVESLLDAPGEDDAGEIRLDTDDGTRFLAVSVSPLGDDEAAQGRLVTFRDVTERHRYERELEEERAKYSTLVEQSHDGVVIVRDGVVVFANRQTEVLLDRDEPEILGTRFRTFVSPETRDTVVDRYERRLRGEDVPSRYDVQLVRPSAERRTVDLQATDIQYEGDRAVMLTLRDITERKAYERSLEEQNRKLEVLNRLVRHDIRNDMTVVDGYVGQLDEELDPGARTEPVTRALDTLQTRSEHVVEVTDVLRDLMETMQGEGNTVRPVPLRDVLDGEVENLRSSTDGDAVVRAGPVPDVTVRADEMLGSVFRNLLTNAVKHSDTGAAEVTVTATAEDDTVVVSVADDGPGIPDAQKEDIFGKGERGLESAGTGIGLYLVETLVSSYDGAVWVEDNEPHGAVFSVELQRVS